MTTYIAVMSGKGGVGKSTVTALIGCILSQKMKTLLLDFDITGPSLYGIFPSKESVKKAEKGLEPIKIADNLYILSMGLLIKEGASVIWRGPKKLQLLNMFLESVDNYDCVVIDLPPGLSEEHTILINKDVISIIVTTSQNIALSDTVNTIEFCLNNKIQIGGILENFSGFECENCGCVTNIFASKGGNMIAEKYGLKFIGALEMNHSIAKMCDNNTFYEEYKLIKNYDVVESFLYENIIKF